MANLATIHGFAQGPTEQIMLLQDILNQEGSHPTTGEKLTVYRAWFEGQDMTLEEVSDTESRLWFDGSAKWSLEATFNNPVADSDVNIHELAEILPESEIVLVSHEAGLQFSEFLQLKDGDLVAFLCEDFEETYNEERDEWEITVFPGWLDVFEETPEDYNVLFDYITP